jgi:hypothetical protein
MLMNCVAAISGTMNCSKGNMSDLLTILPRTPKRIGIASDHQGFGLKEQLVRTFFVVRFRGAERHHRRRSTVPELENKETRS